jgi:hypothetical protein
MHEVWTEIRRKSGGAGRAGPYVHPAQPEMIRLHFGYLEHMSQQPDERDRLQEQACAVLFLVVMSHFIWGDLRSNIGPRTQTQAEANQETVALHELAASHEDDANKHDRLGNWEAGQTLRKLAADSRSQADRRRPDRRNPLIVKRKSSRCGDDWDRGLIIQITQTCRALFGKSLLGTVATLSNVALDREDITRGAVQGVVKHVR